MADKSKTQSPSATASDTSPKVAEKYTVITGAGGFIGARLATKLYARDAKKPLLLVDNLEYFSTRQCCEPFQEFRNVKYLTPADFIIQLQRGMLAIDEVFHLGACSRTDETRENFLLENNFRYSQHIWKACFEQGINLYYASSAATYGAGENGYDDDHTIIPRLKPLNLYGWSKQKFDLFVLEKIATGHTPPHWAGFKFFNVYGPGEEHKGSQATAMLHAFNQYTKNGVMKLFRSHKDGIKDGEQMRDFIFVDDVCKVLMSFADSAKSKGESSSVAPFKNGIFNIGTGKAQTFLTLTEAAAQAMGIDFKVDWIDTPEKLREHYQYFTEAKLDRLRAAGYKGEFTSLEDGAKAFYKEWCQIQVSDT
ncbi:ADP-glyceromanno-heptose 6-epimerase [bacterium]|nr:ADP-glyceromanno-heptose 6-epimerase [bacterium]